MPPSPANQPLVRIPDQVDELPDDLNNPSPDISNYNIIDHLSHFSGLAVAQFYILCAGVTLFEVTMRYVFNAPTQWAFEVAMTLCACAWMLSAGFVTLKNLHIGITVFYIMAKKPVQWWLDFIAM